MALGVLNNLSAIYAENNLNNTNASLQAVLQQLSSGSRINSGADDAAGLSLVNGMGANSAALTQSETNATEGVGLLQVADGALSQVTSLLNRSITLATEASNGTLNSTQESAANQEYQSILAEINNIGSTTTYNQQQVFNNTTTAIYTGDSSQAGSSVDDVYIRTLSSSSIGDTDGAMSYSSGQNNVFIDLSKGGVNASVTDSLNGTGSTALNVSYVTKGAGGAVTNATANITVGTGTTYQNTAQGLIDAINNAGLGLNATFTSVTMAGSAATASANAANSLNGALLTGSDDTGIEISGDGVGVNSSVAGNYTNGPGEVGTLTVANTGDQLTGSLAIVSADGTTHTLNLGTPASTDTLVNLESTINSSGLGVTATLNTTPITNASGSIGGMNGQMSNVNFDNVDIGLQLKDTQPYAIHISNLNVANAGGGTNHIAIQGLAGNAGLNVNGATFWGVLYQPVSWANSGLLTLSNVRFLGWSPSLPCIRITSGRAILQNNYFTDNIGVAISVTPTTQRVMVLGNMLCGNTVSLSAAATTSANNQP